MYLKANPEGYAQALFEIAKEEKLIDKIHPILSNFLDAILSDNKLLEILGDSNISKVQKYELIDDIFKVCKIDVLNNFFKVIIERNAINLLIRIIKYYLKLSNAALNVRYGKIISAYPISSEKLAKIKAKLEKKTGSQIVLEAFVDSSLISGFKIKIDSLIIENNYEHDLQSIKEFLLKKKEV